MKKLKKIDGNILRLLAIFVVITAVAGLTKGTKFINTGNLQSMAKSLTEYGLMSVGVGIAMISGGIDLSTVYVANLCGILAGMTMKSTGGGIIAAVAVALVVGILCGAFNGFLVSVLKIPAMLATLGTYQLYMGIAIVCSKGSTVSGIPREFSSFSQMMILGIPLPFIIFILMIIIIAFIMSKTKFGKRVYLVGTNEKAAKFAAFFGIPKSTPQNKNTLLIFIKTLLQFHRFSCYGNLLSSLHLLFSQFLLIHQWLPYYFHT